MSFKLEANEIRNLESLHNKVKDGRIKDRIKCVVALSKGYSFEQIEEILLIDERTARRYFSIYKEKGEDGLLIFNYKGKIEKLTSIQEEDLKNSKIALIHLPSYSPNLNLIERLWKFFKKKILYNKYYETKNNFILAIDNFFDMKMYKEVFKW